MTLKGKIAVVTGAGNGIGRAISERLAKEFATVIVTDINEEMAGSVADSICASGGFAEAFKLDVLDYKEAVIIIDIISKKFDRVDIWCNNAGVSSMNNVWDISEQEWDFNMDINAKGVFLCTKAILPLMIKQRAGRLINIASIASLRADPLLAHYCASKWAVVGFSRTVATEVGKFGITVNCVCPASVKTSMQDREIIWAGAIRGIESSTILKELINKTPLGRVVLPEDVAGAVAFFAGPDASFITGVALPLTGGSDLP